MKTSLLAVLSIRLLLGVCGGSTEPLSPRTSPPVQGTEPGVQPTTLPAQSTPVRPPAAGAPPVIVGMSDQSISDLETFPLCC